MDLSLLLRGPHESAPVEVLEAYMITEEIPELRLGPGDMVYQFSTGETLHIDVINGGLPSHFLERVSVTASSAEGQRMMRYVEAVRRWEGRTGN